MKSIYIASLICGATLMGMNSCSLLDVPQENLITNNTFWKGPGDAKAHLTGLYNNLLSNQNSSLWGEDRGDSFKPGEIGPVTNAHAQVLTEENAPSYRTSYYIIHNLNLLFQKIETLTFTNESERSQIKAEAHVMRAMVYFHLVKIWGDSPIVIEPTLTDNVPNTSRSSKEDVMEYILKDITAALLLFPTEGYENKNFISKPAAFALKADVYMWKAKVHGGGAIDLTEAIDAIGQVESSGVSLLPTYADVFSNNNKKNSEIIFSMFIRRYETNNLRIAANTSSRTDNIANADNIDDAATSPNQSRHVYAPSDELRAMYDLNPTDMRKQSAIIDLMQGEVVLLTQTNKFRGKDYGDDRFFDDDLIVYRWADMLLLRAEASAALGKLTDAIKDLNTIRNRAEIGDYSGPIEKIALEKEICNERLRELFLEQKRWFDLVRFHVGGTINIYDVVPNLKGKVDYPLYWPINFNDMVSNDKLVQTKGYETSFPDRK